MPRIIPIKDLKNTALISQLCESSNEPIYVTKNGYGHMVVMSLEAYEEEKAKFALYDKLAEAEEQFKQGKYVDGDELIGRLKQKYGL